MSQDNNPIRQSSDEYLDYSLNATVDGEKLTDIPEGLYIPPQALEVILESFSGPLDLLLYLIRKQNIDILDIPVASITDQYMQYVELMRQINLDLAAEYLLMAAMLAQIKSRMLVPTINEDDEDGDDPRAVLVARLQEYERFRKAAIDLDDRPRLERDIYLAAAHIEDKNDTLPLPEVEIKMLTAAFELVVERAKRNQKWFIEREVLSVRQRMSILLEKLRSQKSLGINEMFFVDEGRMGLVVSFIAILELVKDHVIMVYQDNQDENIYIKSVSDDQSSIKKLNPED